MLIWSEIRQLVDKYHEEAFLKVIRSRNIDGGIMNKRII